MDRDVEKTRACMAEASRVVLGGFELRTEANVICYPDRYMDKRGVEMWQRVTRLIGKRKAKEEAA